MVNLSKISESLQELMAERNLNQTMLANAMGIANAKLSTFITCKRAPNYDTFISLLNFFNCSADFLLGLSEYPCENIIYKPVQPFGNRIKAVLQERGVSQYRLIKETKISWNTFHGWAHDKCNPSVDNLVKLAKYFNISVDNLLGRV